MTESRRFAEFASEHSPALLGYIARRVHSIESAPEVLNDTLLVAWKKRQQLPSDPERARMWLFVTARNCIRNHERSTRRRRLAENGLDVLVEAVTTMTDDDSGEVRMLVLALPQKYRELVMLVHWDGFSIVDAARLLGVSDSTARTRYSRAKEQLRAQLESSFASRG